MGIYTQALPQLSLSSKHGECTHLCAFAQAVPVRNTFPFSFLASAQMSPLNKASSFPTKEELSLSSLSAWGLCTCCVLVTRQD